MRDQDRIRFASQLAAMAEIYGKGVSEAAAEAWFATLHDVSIEDFERAMMAHLRDPDVGRFVPKPADILAQLRGAAAQDGRPDADEAFAMLPKSEAETAVWTPEMAQAWYAGACDLYQTDRVGARMAFRSAYERYVRSARASGDPVKWQVSMGHDTHGRAEPIRKAIADGRLPKVAAQLLPAPVDESAQVLTQALARAKALA
jgi:hypothetical protein